MCSPPPHTQKFAFCSFIHNSYWAATTKIEKSKNPKIQKSKKKMQASVDVKSFGFLDFWILDFWIFGFLDFWIFGFLDCWICCVLHLCFQTVETAPKLDSEKKKTFVAVFTVLLRGVRVVGGVTIYIYTHIYIYIYW